MSWLDRFVDILIPAEFAVIGPLFVLQVLNPGSIPDWFIFVVGLAVAIFCLLLTVNE